jgi:hypothetical protein
MYGFLLGKLSRGNFETIVYIIIKIIVYLINLLNLKLIVYNINNIDIIYNNTKNNLF